MDRAGGELELEPKHLALVSKSTLNRRQGLELCTGKTTVCTAKNWSTGMIFPGTEHRHGNM